MTASLLTEVCTNVATEPHLQPLSGEAFCLTSANTSDGARLDVRASGFWAVGQDTFLDVRVFHPDAPTYRPGRLSTVYKRHEEMRRSGSTEKEVEHSVFTSLVFSTSEGIGKECQMFYKRLADMLSHKRDLPYSNIMGWLRCKLSFALLRSCILCIPGP